MENQKASSTSIMLNYGLMLSFASILIAVVNYVVGDVYKPHWSITVISLAVSTTGIVYGLMALKQSNDGLLNLGEALKLGLGISLISGIVYVLYLFLFTNFIEPEYFTNLAKVQESVMLEAYPNMTDEQLEEAMAMSAKMSSLGMIAAITLIMSLFFGFIISLIAGLIMKRSEEDLN